MLSSRVALLVTIGFLLVPWVLLADQVDELLAGSGYSDSEKEMIREVFEGAKERDVPSELLEPRLAEGIAKNVGARRVASVLSTDLDRYVRARRLLRVAGGENALPGSRGAWNRTATLLAAGVQESVISEIAGAAAAEPDAYRPATELYVSLREWGLSSTLSAELGAAAVRSRLTPAEYPGLIDILTAARRSRMDPEDVSREIIRVLPDAGSIRTMRQQLGLQD